MAVQKDKAKFQCDICKKYFLNKTPHNCIGGYRKHGISWIPINNTQKITSMATKPKLDLMFDIETLASSNKSKGLILEVGMQPFFRDGSECKLPSVAFTLDVLESLLFGRTVEEDTVNWWKKQPKEIKEKLLVHNSEWNSSIEAGFTKLYDTIKDFSKTYSLCPWSKGIDFDFPLIESYWTDLGIPSTPYLFYKKRDVRTFLEVAEELGWKNPQKASDIEHSALQDCKDQIVLIQDAYKLIKSK